MGQFKQTVFSKGISPKNERRLVTAFSVMMALYSVIETSATLVGQGSTVTRLNSKLGVVDWVGNNNDSNNDIRSQNWLRAYEGYKKAGMGDADAAIAASDPEITNRDTSDE